MRAEAAAAAAGSPGAGAGATNAAAGAAGAAGAEAGAVAAATEAAAAGGGGGGGLVAAAAGISHAAAVAEWHGLLHTVITKGNFFLTEVRTPHYFHNILQNPHIPEIFRGCCTR